MRAGAPPKVLYQICIRVSVIIISVNGTQTFSIKTDVFEGPLELLLELIEKRKLLINDVSLATVTDEYMDYVSKLQENTMRETSHFVLVASTLLLIKSKSLLPILELTEEESESISDLEYRLRLYDLFRKISRDIQQQFGASIMYPRTFIPDTKPIFTTDRFTTTKALREAMQDIVKDLPKKIVRNNVSVEKVVSLEDTIRRLHDRITKQFKLSFKDFAGGDGEQKTVIVSFLAVLELVKQGVVMVQQEARFADFHIEREDIDMPKY